MRYLLLPFFILELLINILGFSIRYFLFRTAYLKIFLLIFIFFITQMAFFYQYFQHHSSLSYLNNQSNKKEQDNQAVAQLNFSHFQTYPVKNNFPEIQIELDKYEKLIDQQAFNRDLLINAYLLNLSLHQNNRAQEYLKKAQYLDPNNELFKNIKSD